MERKLGFLGFMAIVTLGGMVIAGVLLGLGLVSVKVDIRQIDLQLGLPDEIITQIRSNSSRNSGNSSVKRVDEEEFGLMLYNSKNNSRKIIWSSGRELPESDEEIQFIIILGGAYPAGVDQEKVTPLICKDDKSDQDTIVFIVEKADREFNLDEWILLLRKEIKCPNLDMVK